jgi:hypothetical protein
MVESTSHGRPHAEVVLIHSLLSRSNRAKGTATRAVDWWCEDIPFTSCGGGKLFGRFLVEMNATRLNRKRGDAPLAV